MLRELSIKNIVLIDSLNLEIGAGFTALTGETGAGKSILLDALGIALGDRADKSLIRDGNDKAHVTACFDINKNSEIIKILEENNIDFENDEIVLRRNLNNDGKSRAYINDISVSLGLLKNLTQELLEIHGQHTSIGLMNVASHLETYDSYLENKFLDEFIDLKKSVKNNWSNYLNAKQTLKIAQDNANKSGAERDYMEFIVKELDKLSPQIGEEIELDSQRRFFMASEKITEAIKESITAIENGKVESNLSNAARALSRVGLVDGENGAKLNTLLDKAANAIEKAQNEVADSLALLNQCGYSIDIDSGSLEKVEERLFSLRGAARKHSVTVDELPAFLERTKNQLAFIENSEAELIKANENLLWAKNQYDEAANKLSKFRKIKAEKFENSVSNELAPLKLEKMRFRISFEIANPSASGIDNLIFEIAPNPGVGFGPLSQIASGGELSRLSLALKMVLATGNGRTIAMVFDEIDQGIGGATADAVGKRLKVLAKSNQILCVTHSPQVAARANHHLKIEKIVKDGITTTMVRQLSNIEREEELARMLSGETITTEARAAARALTTGADT